MVHITAAHDGLRPAMRLSAIMGAPGSAIWDTRMPFIHRRSAELLTRTDPRVGGESAVFPSQSRAHEASGAKKAR